MDNEEREVTKHPDEVVDTKRPDGSIDRKAWNALKREYEGDPKEVDGQAEDEDPDEATTRSVRGLADVAPILYPWGYQRALVTEERLWELARMDLAEPETADRFKAFIRSRGGAMGIGGAVRFVQPDKPGFADPGKSFHELQQWSDGRKAFAALDLVMRNGGNIHRAPRWDEVPRQGTAHADMWDYGVHCNVTGEPWHLQPLEVDGWQGWVNRGRPMPNPDFPIRGTISPPAPPAPPAPQPPAVTYGPGERTLSVQDPLLQGIDVAYIQQTITREGIDLRDDGVYGPVTADAVKEVQKWNKLEVDGVVGPKTWAAIIAYNAPKPAPPAGPQPGERTLRHTSPTMTGPDVLWLQEVLRNQGLAVSIDGVYGRQTVDRVKTMQGWNNLTQDGVVGPKTWEALKRY